ncbi:hypothetical protein [Streptomyces niveus]|uniref:hypothetical protein n=1 Tax=Streptomyces niveus TaxID=193462 RepID=UPI00342014A8
MSTGLTMVWIPAGIEQAGQAAGVPEAIASWEVVPLWLLTLAVPAGAWLSTRHTGSRAVTVLLCHLTISIAALPAAVFPATSLSTAAGVMLTVLLLRSGAPAALRAALLRIRSRHAPPLREVRDSEGRLWFAIALPEADQRIYVGAGGKVAVLHPMPRGRITLDRVDERSGQNVSAYALNRSAPELARNLTRFAIADRTLARKLSIDVADVTTVVTAPAAGLSEERLNIDLMGLWDTGSHTYADHRALVVGVVRAEATLHHVRISAHRHRWGGKTRRAVKDAEDLAHGDRHQRRVAATCRALS